MKKDTGQDMTDEEFEGHLAIQRKERRERSVKRLGGIELTVEQLKQRSPELYKWINKLFCGQIVELPCVIVDHDSYECIYFFLYTNEYRYRITAKLPDPNGKKKTGYLGDGYTCRKSYAGENWIRGDDLDDGSFNEKTWDEIIHSIVRNELVQLDFR